jgi:hypothetical protein
VLGRHRTTMIARMLSLALLLAQLGAEAHAISHLDDDPHGIPNAAQSCRACLSFAPVVGAVGNTQAALRIEPADAQPVVSTYASPVTSHRPHPAFRSRAPPALL